MVDDIPMGNTLFISIFIILSPIETIFSWVHQMFGVIEQKLNKQTIQMVNLKRKKKTTDKIELKKEHATQMVDFRTILLK